MRTDQIGAVYDRMDTIDRRISGVADALKAALNACEVLALRTYTFDASGIVTDQWAIDYRAVAVYSQSSAVVTGDAAGPQSQRPQTGAGVFNVPIRGFVTVNVSGRALTLYGTPGDAVTVAVFPRPQPPNAAAGPAATNVTAVSSVSASGSVPDIGAAGIIATTPTLNGLYRIDCSVMFLGSGTPADLDCTNFQVNNGFKPLCPKTVGVVSPVQSGVYRFTNATCSLRSIVAGTASVAYTGNLIATRIGD